MRAGNKMMLGIITYCAFTWLTNWSLVFNFDSVAGTTTRGIHLVGIAAFIGCIVSVWLLIRIWKLTRELLAEGRVIPLKRKLWGTWSVLLFVLPLGISLTYSGDGITSDSLDYKWIFQYGGTESTPWNIFFTISTIMLYQLYFNMLLPRDSMK